MERTHQLRTVSVDRGLFLVRYAAAEDQEQPPHVKLSADPSSKKDISFILYPDHNEPILWEPDTCLVVRATAAGKLAVQVIPMEEGGSTAATVRIEPISQGQAATPPTNQASSDFGDLRLLGHLTGLGDVTVKADEWLGGPSSPMRIEGIAVDWAEKPSDLQIRYAVKTARPMPVSGQTTELGSFAGTRGRAMPIVGLMLELTGLAAAHFQFCVEAIFLGSPATRIISNRVVASGPTGREPLVGLRLSLKRVEAAEELETRAPASRHEVSADRVRVFRSRPKSNQSAIA
ncbi:MAG: hypothetical protein WB760_32585 [Xanthobacteraceae bacterium]